MPATKRKKKSEVVENTLRSGYDSGKDVNESTTVQKPDFLRKLIPLESTLKRCYATPRV